MTKKDYELFASALNEYAGNKELKSELNFATELIANCFQKDNYSFNREKFIEACETGKHIRRSIKEGV